MRVFVLIEQGRFAGVFATADLAKSAYADWKKHLGVEIRWVISNPDVSHPSCYIDKDCKMGTVEIRDCPVFDS